MGQVIAGPRAQYAALSGTTHRTPPLGSATSPCRRGMTWTWACITVCPAAAPSLRPTLNPSGFSSATSTARTWATSRQTAACSSFGQIEQAGDVPPGDDEGVAFRDAGIRRGSPRRTRSPGGCESSPGWQKGQSCWCTMRGIVATWMSKPVATPDQPGSNVQPILARRTVGGSTIWRGLSGGDAAKWNLAMPQSIPAGSDAGARPPRAGRPGRRDRPPVRPAHRLRTRPRRQALRPQGGHRPGLPLLARPHPAARGVQRRRGPRPGELRPAEARLHRRSQGRRNGDGGRSRPSKDWSRAGGRPDRRRLLRRCSKRNSSAEPFSKAEHRKALAPKLQEPIRRVHRVQAPEHQRRPGRARPALHRRLQARRQLPGRPRHRRSRATWTGTPASSTSWRRRADAEPEHRPAARHAPDLDRDHRRPAREDRRPVDDEQAVAVPEGPEDRLRRAGRRQPPSGQARRAVRLRPGAASARLRPGGTTWPARVEWARRDIGDGLGFDVLSFDDADDSERCIEVKTTGLGKFFPFYVTAQRGPLLRGHARSSSTCSGSSTSGGSLGSTSCTARLRTLCQALSRFIPART